MTFKLHIHIKMLYTFVFKVHSITDSIYRSAFRRNLKLSDVYTTFNTTKSCNIRKKFHTLEIR